MSDSATPGAPRATAPPQPEDPTLLNTLRQHGPGRLVFGRFRLARELGAGGMAVVWLANDERLGLEVALKFLPGMVASDPEALHDLRREITRGLKLTHPGIVRVYDLHEDSTEGLAAIAMEYIDGSTLGDMKTRQPERCFDVAEPLLTWARELCDVLSYVHEKARVVHRDLKPRNLMLTATGDLKVADFGIAATLCDSQSRLTQDRGSSGTPVYMSPQQALGRAPRAADDIYAIGATLYELLTSKPPFFRGSMSVILNQVACETAPTMAERREEFGLTGRAPIPPAWEETIAACLAKEPESRPASVREVAQRLGLSGAPYVPPPAAPSPPLSETAATVQAPPPRPIIRVGDRPQGEETAVTVAAKEPAPERAPKPEAPEVAAKSSSNAGTWGFLFLVLVIAGALLIPYFLHSREVARGERMNAAYNQAAEQAKHNLQPVFNAEAAQLREQYAATVKILDAREGTEDLKALMSKTGLIRQGEKQIVSDPSYRPNLSAEGRASRIGLAQADGIDFRKFAFYRCWSGGETPEKEAIRRLVPALRAAPGLSDGDLVGAERNAALFQLTPLGILAGPTTAPKPIPPIMPLATAATFGTSVVIPNYFIAGAQNASFTKASRIAGLAGDATLGLANYRRPEGLTRVPQTLLACEYLNDVRLRIDGFWSAFGQLQQSLELGRPQSAALLYDQMINYALIAKYQLGINEEAQRLWDLEIRRIAHLLLEKNLPPTEADANATPPPIVQPGNPSLARKETPFVNSLGMKFVPVLIQKGPDDGKVLLFSAWDTRVQDYAVFVAETGRAVESLDLAEKPTHPVSSVSWEDARFFCRWLSKKEGRTYRLPSDHEWSCAADIGTHEDPFQSPASKSGKWPGYPWGTKFPPPTDFGNFAMYGGKYSGTSPVGSYPPDFRGLFDMSGNLWQWCQDPYSPTDQQRHVLRGGYFSSFSKEELVTSYRAKDLASAREYSNGFRCVLELPSR